MKKNVNIYQLSYKNPAVLKDYYGYLEKKENGYIYIKSNLKIEEIKSEIEKKYYFSFKKREKDIGPHISVIYEDEKYDELTLFENKKFKFTLKSLVKINFFSKFYLAFLVDSLEITEFRISCGLKKKLFFRNEYIPLHLTIGELIDTI